MTKKNETQYLDLDAVVSERKRVVLKFKGKEHELKQVTVRTFVENTKALQEIGAQGSLEAETTAIIKIIRGSFPTLEEDELWDLGLDQLNKIMEFARENNGEAQISEGLEDEASDQGNSQTAA
ncbi:MAG: hypothetical protein JJ979_03320 [Roseibium sp.]|nr:hypothetical protein [Roseibium sp.]